MELKGGGKLEKALADIASKMQGGSVSVGFMAGATYPDGTSVPSVAFWDEFGTSRIPARPFFRTTIAEKSNDWAKKVGQSVKHYGYDSDKILSFMGETIQQDVQSSINGWQDPPNAASTVRQKGFDSPLRDTMQMHNSVDYLAEKS